MVSDSNQPIMQTINTNFVLLLASVYRWHHVDAAALSGDHDFGIYGGKPAKITEVPFMSILRPKYTSSNWFCGASIINKQFLISAAHCAVEVKDPEEMRITVGTDSIEEGQDYDIAKIVSHPKYFHNKSMFDYDLAVIKLKTELDFNDHVAPIVIADSTLPKTGEIMQVLGFGNTENNNTMSKILLKLDLPFVDEETCVKLINNPDMIITKQVICAGGKKGQSACNGDSGGPVTYKGKLIGAVSCRYTEFECAAGIPEGFAYIPSMMDFVEDVIKEYS